MIKKVLLSAAIVSCAFCAQAEESYGPQGGDFSTEIQFSPFASDGNTFSMTALSGRYFFSSADAFTVELGIGGTNEKKVPDTSNSNSYTKDYTGRFILDLGYQRHFYNYKRVDLYVGGKVGYIKDFAGHKSQTDDQNWTWNNSGTGSGFNVYLTTGIDFYVYKGVYLGAEINLGMEDILASNVTYKNCSGGVEKSNKSQIGGHNFKGGFDVNPKIRLGWTF